MAQEAALNEIQSMMREQQKSIARLEASMSTAVAAAEATTSAPERKKPSRADRRRNNERQDSALQGDIAVAVTTAVGKLKAKVQARKEGELQPLSTGDLICLRLYGTRTHTRPESTGG